MFFYELTVEGTLHDLFNFNMARVSEMSSTLRVHIPVAIFCNLHRQLATNLFQIPHALHSSSCKTSR